MAWTGPRCACAAGSWPSAPTSTTGPPSLPGPAALPIGPPAAGPTPVLPPPSSSQTLKSTSPTPRAFEDFFRVPRPLLSRWRLRPVQTLLLLRRGHKTLGTFSKVLLRRWFEAGKLSGSRIWNSTGNSYKVTLHLSRPRVPLYPKGTWAPTHCGSWVPLTTERRHGLSISPVQNELAVNLADTVAPARGPLLIAIGQGTADLRGHRTPPPRRDTDDPLPNAPAQTDARGPMTVVHLKAGSVLNALADLGPLALQATAVVITLSLLHLHAGIGVARLPLVGPMGPAWLRGLLGAPRRCHCGGHHLINDGLPIPHGTVIHLLRPVLEGLIIAYHLLLLGRLHPKGPEPRVSLSPVASPGLSAGNVAHIPMIRIFVSCDCGWTAMMNIIHIAPIHVVPLNQDNLHPWMTLLSLWKRSKNFSPIWSRRQHSRTTQIQSRIVPPISSWYHTYAHLHWERGLYRGVPRSHQPYALSDGGITPD